MDSGKSTYQVNNEDFGKVNFSERLKELEKSNIPLSFEHFNIQNKPKKTGKDKGCFATDLMTNDKYHFRHFPKQFDELIESDISSEKEYNEFTQSFLNEYILGPLYKLFLPQATPEIYLVNSTSNPENIYLASKFLLNFRTFKDYSKSPPNINDAAVVKGSEILFVLIALFGEMDIQQMNIGVIINSENKRFLAKIDHAFSCLLKYSKPEALIHSLFELLNYYQYIQFDLLLLKERNRAILELDISKFIAAIDYVLSAPFEIIESIIKQRVELLKKQKIIFTNFSLDVVNDNISGR